MPIKIFLSSTLRRYLPGYDSIIGMEYTADGEITVTELCRQLKIPADHIKIVMVNGRSEGMDYLLKGDERVGLFPPVGGG
jgi:molybdopterin synthase sulfur carrier subunit